MFYITGRMLLNQLNMELSPKSTSMLDSTINTALVNSLKSALKKSIMGAAKPVESVPVGQFKVPSLPDIVQETPLTESTQQVMSINNPVNQLVPPQMAQLNDRITKIESPSLPAIVQETSIRELPQTVVSMNNPVDQSVPPNMAEVNNQVGQLVSSSLPARVHETSIREFPQTAVPMNNPVDQSVPPSTAQINTPIGQFDSHPLPAMVQETILTTFPQTLMPVNNRVDQFVPTNVTQLSNHIGKFESLSLPPTAQETSNQAFPQTVVPSDNLSHQRVPPRMAQLNNQVVERVAEIVPQRTEIDIGRFMPMVQETIQSELPNQTVRQNKLANKDTTILNVNSFKDTHASVHTMQNQAVAIDLNVPGTPMRVVEESGVFAFPGRVQMGEPALKSQPHQPTFSADQSQFGSLTTDLPIPTIVPSISLLDLQNLASDPLQQHMLPLPGDDAALMKSQILQQLATFSQEPMSDMMSQPTSGNVITKAENAIASLKSVLQTQLLPSVLSSFTSTSSNSNQPDQAIFGTPAAQKVVPVDPMTNLQLEQFNNAFNSRLVDIPNIGNFMYQQPFAVPTQIPPMQTNVMFNIRNIETTTQPFEQLTTMPVATSQQVMVSADTTVPTFNKDTFVPKRNKEQMFVAEQGLMEQSNIQRSFSPPVTPIKQDVQNKPILDIGLNGNNRFQAPVALGQETTTEAPAQTAVNSTGVDTVQKNTSVETGE